MRDAVAAIFADRANLAATLVDARGVEQRSRQSDDRAVHEEDAERQQHHRVVDALQQMMVEPDFAELVDQHGGVAEVGNGQHARQQGRLAAAQEARQHR